VITPDSRKPPPSAWIQTPISARFASVPIVPVLYQTTTAVDLLIREVKFVGLLTDFFSVKPAVRITAIVLRSKGLLCNSSFISVLKKTSVNVVCVV